jgi:hypothetical protein
MFGLAHLSCKNKCVGHPQAIEGSFAVIAPAYLLLLRPGHIQASSPSRGGRAGRRRWRAHYRR